MRQGWFILIPFSYSVSLQEDLPPVFCALHRQFDLYLVIFVAELSSTHAVVHAVLIIPSGSAPHLSSFWVICLAVIDLFSVPNEIIL